MWLQRGKVRTKTDIMLSDGNGDVTKEKKMFHSVARVSDKLSL